MLLVVEVQVRRQTKQENGENIYEGHVARKPFIPKVPIIVLLQLRRLQLTLIDNSPAIISENHKLPLCI